jgi:quercetin dioxygenase-like cupin family protein
MSANKAVRIVPGGGGERLNVLGAEVILKSGGVAAHVLVADHPFPAGYGVPMHVHEDEDEMFYVLEGELTFESEGRVTVAGPGTFVHLPRGVAHGFCNTSGRAARALVIASPGGALLGVMRGLDAAARENAPLDGPRIGAIAAANRIRLVDQQTGPGQRESAPLLAFEWH